MHNALDGPPGGAICTLSMSNPAYRPVPRITNATRALANVSVALPIDVIESIDRLCVARNKRRSTLLRELLETHPAVLEAARLEATPSAAGEAPDMPGPPMESDGDDLDVE